MSHFGLKLFNKSILFASACCLMLLTTSCITLKQASITKDYSKNVSSYESNLTVDQLWSNVIDFFSETGVGIQTLDKSSGIIIGQDYNFSGKFTVENEMGELKDSMAWVVCNCDTYKDQNGEIIILPATTSLGNFNVRIKEESGKSKVSINLVNFRFARTYSGLYGIQSTSGFQAFSTGVFEKTIMYYIDKSAKKL